MPANVFLLVFLVETPKRVLPKDSHYFLLDPINPFKGKVFGAGFFNMPGGLGWVGDFFLSSPVGSQQTKKPKAKKAVRSGK